jgi:hypothetical protein
VTNIWFRYGLYWSVALIVLSLAISCQGSDDERTGIESRNVLAQCTSKYVKVADKEVLVVDELKLVNAQDILQCVEDLCCRISYDTTTPFLKYDATEALIRIVSSNGSFLQEADYEMIRCVIAAHFVIFLKHPVPDLGNEGRAIAMKNERMAYELLHELTILKTEVSEDVSSRQVSFQELQAWLKKNNC